MKNNNYASAIDLQLALIRIYLGLDFIHHFAEKFGLLGPTAYTNVKHYFASLGLSVCFVIIAGFVSLLHLLVLPLVFLRELLLLAQRYI